MLASLELFVPAPTLHDDDDDDECHGDNLKGVSMTAWMNAEELKQKQDKNK